MKTITTYTHFEISAIFFGVTHAKCWPEKPNFSHSEDIGYELTITIPEDAKISANEFGDVLLDIPGETFFSRSITTMSQTASKADTMSLSKV